MTAPVIDETYRRWEPVENYIHWLTAKTLDRRYTYNALKAFIFKHVARHQKQQNLTDDMIVHMHAIELSVAVRMIQIRSGPNAALVWKDDKMTMAFGFLKAALDMQSANNPFPEKMAEGLFTIFTEAVQKSEHFKGKPYMKQSKLVFVWTLAVAVLALAEIELLSRN